MKWAAIVGAAREGRDVAIDALLREWRAAGVPVGGFRPREGAGRDERGKMLDIFLENVATGARIPYAVTDPNTADVCSYRFEPAAFEAACEWCVAAARKGGVVLLAGLGPLEAAGRGHAEAIRQIVAAPGAALPVLAIRRDALSAIALALPDPVADLDVPADATTIHAFATAVLRAIRPEKV